MTHHQQGFTLVELIVSITLIGILAVVAVPMVRTPMQAYMDASQRAELAGQLDASVAKMRDDLAAAVPNSIRVRVAGQRRYIEFMPAVASGRYRSQAAATVCPNDMLEFAPVTEGCFTSLTPLQACAPAAAGCDWVVVNAIDSNGVLNQDPYFGGAATPANGVKARFLNANAAGLGSRITMTAHQFQAPPANKQFYIASNPVSYGCDPVGTRQLTRYNGYAMAAVQPIVFPAASGAPLATLISGCEIKYTPIGALGRGGVVSVWLRFTAPSAGTGAPESIESFSVISVREPT